jgi:hypothetical protein
VPLALIPSGVVEFATRTLEPTPIVGPPVGGISTTVFVLRHAALAGVLTLLGACLMPAVGTWSASLVAYGKDALEVATKLAGAPARTAGHAPPQPPGSASAVLGAIPGFAAMVVIVLVLVAAPWLFNETPALPASVVLFTLAGASVLLILAVRARAPRVMGTILRDVSALDRQRLATLEVRPPTAIERLVASLLGEAALPYRKDARLMRRRYPMAFALGALCFAVLVIVGLARPTDPMPWLVAVLAGAAMYGIALAGRLFRPPIELPRLAATLPISRAARARAKVAWLVAWAVVFVGIPVAFVAVRLT